MLKNVTLLPDSKNGKRTWKLLGPLGLQNEPFTLFANSIARTKSKNTLDSYCRHLAQFFDYLFEAALSLHLLRPDEPFTASTLLDVIEGYDEYLVYGEDSGDEVARLVAGTLQSPRNKRQTSALKHAAVRTFLRLSDRIHKQTLELVNAGLHDPRDVSGELLGFHEFRVPPTTPQRQAMLGNSMLAGVIAGGSKFVPSAILPTVVYQPAFDNGRAFPFDKLEEFINALPSHRDRTFYSFLAASGCRTHEGLQLLFDDIDLDGRNVRLVDPSSRPNCESYLYLTPEERYSLAWKGRTTQKTLLIEPFASIFFEELALYLKNEYIPHGLHRFVFQYRRSLFKGRPFFLSDSDSRSELFHKTASLCGIEKHIHGPHSLRHAYATYLLNYFPRMDGGFGLGIGIVQQIMGHAELKSTQKYAKHDQALIDVELRFANAMVFGKGEKRSLAQMKLDALYRQVNNLEAEFLADQRTRMVFK